MSKQEQQAQTVKLGDRVKRWPVSFGLWRDGEDRYQKPPAMTGVVIYIHPRGRFHLVEFQTPGGPLRECFPGV